MHRNHSSGEHWHWSLKLLHWVMAVLIVAMIGLGWVMTNWRPSLQTAFSLYQAHKSIGVVIFVLVIMRVAARLRYGALPLPGDMPAVERYLASFVQALLYATMLAMPLTGWLIGSAAGFPTKPFGLFTLPDLISRNPPLAEIFRTTHEILSFVLVGALVLHVAGAIKHHFWNRDNILVRMFPERRR